MTHKLTVLSLTLLCLSGVYGVELENLCKNDFFSYKNVLVNSFYRLLERAVLLPAPYYLIDIFDNCEDDRFDDTATRDRALELKNEYNQRIAHLYSDKSHTDKEWNKYTLAAEYADFDRFIRELAELNSRQDNDLPEDWNCLARFQESIRRGQDLTLSFAPFYRHQFQQALEGEHIRPTREQQFGVLRNALNHWFDSWNENQTMLFEADEIEETYEKEIVWPARFFLNPNKDKMDLENSLTILYEIVFPFHDKNYDDQKHCEPAERLPLFFPRTPKLDL